MKTALVIAALSGVASGFVPAAVRVLSTYAPQSRAAVASPSRVAQSVTIRNASPTPLNVLKESLESTAGTDGSAPSTEPPSDWQSQILSALSVVVDPDLDADIVSLGFVQNVRIDDSSAVSFDLELATPFTIVKDAYVQQCRDVVDAFEWSRGVADVTVITRQAEPTPGAPLGMSQIGAVVAVSSCKGGVGKSTTAVNLAFALDGMGARVGIFDADVYGPSLPTMVTPEDDKVMFVGRQIAPLRRGDVSLMSFGYVNEGSAIMRGPMVNQLLDQFLSLTNWGALDYLIMDMPPGTGDIQLTLSQKLNIDAAVIVTTPQELSFVDVERGVEMFDTVNVPSIAVVENMAYYEREKEELGVEIDEPSLREKFSEALRRHGVVGEPEGAAAAAVDDLVEIVRENVRAEPANGENEKIRLFGPGHKRRLSEQWGIEHQYSIPLLGKIAANGDSGTPFVLENPDTPQAEVYRQLARSVVSEVAKTKFGKGRGGGRPGVTYDSETNSIRVEDRGGDGDDEEIPAIPPAELRRACRCAACVEELTGEQILNPESVPESIEPISMTPTGNYALSVNWSDGHRSLYPYRQIKSMLGAESDANNIEGVEKKKEKGVHKI